MISFRQYSSKKSSNSHSGIRGFPKLNEAKPKRLFKSRRSNISKNCKKNYIEESRYTEIERENRILLEKIHKIIKKPFDISYRKVTGSRKYSKQRNGSVFKKKAESANEVENGNRAGFRYYYSGKESPVLVIDRVKVINNKKFSVKIVELGDIVKIIASNKEDSYRLIVNSAELFPEFARKGDWEGILDCIYMEDEQLVLFMRPFSDSFV